MCGRSQGMRTLLSSLFFGELCVTNILVRKFCGRNICITVQASQSIFWPHKCTSRLRLIPGKNLKPQTVETARTLHCYIRLVYFRAIFQITDNITIAGNIWEALEIDCLRLAYMGVDSSGNILPRNRFKQVQTIITLF